MLPKCPSNLPEEIMCAARALASAYATSELRPKLLPEVIRHWDTLIEEWSETVDLPLFVRKQSANIGELLPHAASGRLLAPCDNSPAHWAIITAFSKATAFSIDDVRQEIKNHGVPVCMVMTLTEVAESVMKGVGAKQANASKLGWKVDHIEDVGLNQRGKVEHLSLADLKGHFCRLMKPSNIVLVPSALEGLGDMPAFIDIIRRTE